MASSTGQATLPSGQADDLNDLLRDYQADSINLTDKEREIIDLYDRIQQNDLQLQILQVETSGHAVADDVSALSDDELRQHMISEERKMLDARAAYLNRNQIVRNTLIMDPILKAVHPGHHTSSLEGRLLPLLNRRDVLALTQSTLDSRLAEVSDALANSQQESMTVNQENQKLAEVLLQLTDEMKAQDDLDIQEPKIRDRLEKLEAEVRKSRRDWRIIKSILSSVIVGSGIEWAKDVGLRELVMDDEDDGD